MTRIGLVSDTHGLVRPELLEAFEGVERILHMGDVGAPDVLERLGELAPVTAVRGNVDHGAWAERLPTTQVVEAFGLDLYLIHILADLDIDPAAAGVRMVLHGHSHRPASEERDGVLYVNPGSAGPRRFRDPVSWAFLEPGPTVTFGGLASD